MKSDSGKPAGGPTIQSQIHLPFSKAWEISLKSIRIRLLRSIITAAGVFLGIAFYSSVKTSGLFPMAGDPHDPAVLAAAHRQEWLAIMALLVCAVGITNSMLMAVTERFKEIGTMKCLGALNSFIVKLFFIEAGLMGLISSVLGWFAGWFIVCVVHMFSDGPHAFTSHVLSGSLKQAIISTSIGLIITLLAAIPPAVNAAKMPPAVALRTTI
jgi:putative ABC transport system permease protein